MQKPIGLILLVALGLTSYHWFQKHYPFRFEESQVVLWPEPNSDAFLVYRRRVVQFNIPDTFRTAEDIRKLYGRLRSGNLDPGRLERQCDKITRRLYELNDELTGRTTPDVFLVPARALARGQGDFYRCVGKLRKVPRAQSQDDREKLFQQAWSDWQSGWRNASIARQGIRLDIHFREPAD